MSTVTIHFVQGFLCYKLSLHTSLLPCWGVGELEGLFGSWTVSVWILYGMWCDQTVYGLDLFLHNDTFNSVLSPWKWPQHAHWLHHHLKHFVMCTNRIFASASCSLAWIMGISINLLPFSTNCLYSTFQVIFVTLLSTDVIRCWGSDIGLGFIFVEQICNAQLCKCQKKQCACSSHLSKHLPFGYGDSGFSTEVIVAWFLCPTSKPTSHHL